MYQSHSWGAPILGNMRPCTIAVNVSTLSGVFSSFYFVSSCEAPRLQSYSTLTRDIQNTRWCDLIIPLALSHAGFGSARASGLVDRLVRPRSNCIRKLYPCRTSFLLFVRKVTCTHSSCSLDMQSRPISSIMPHHSFWHWKLSIERPIPYPPRLPECSMYLMRRFCPESLNFFPLHGSPPSPGFSSSTSDTVVRVMVAYATKRKAKELAKRKTRQNSEAIVVVTTSSNVFS